MDPKATITRAQVLHVAKLARLELSVEEIDRTQTQLAAILGYVDAISALDVSGVEPYFRAFAPEGALRSDVTKPSLPRDVALSQAPASADGGFAVPKVMEDDG